MVDHSVETLLPQVGQPPLMPDSSHRFRAFVATATPAEPALPLVHTTLGKSLNEVLLTGRLKVSRHERLLYLFYGLPLYRPGSKLENSSELWTAPVTFVLKQNSGISIKRVFPFDSGACENGLYHQYLGDQFTVNEFALPPDHMTPQRVVGAFFGNNLNYWKGAIPRSCVLRLDKLDFHSKLYCDLNSASHETKYDRRSGIVEVQCEREIDLNSETLEALVVPDPLKTHDDVRRLASDCGATILGYRFRKGRSGERAADVERQLESWLKKQKRIGR